MGQDAIRDAGVVLARVGKARSRPEELRVSLWAQQLNTPYSVSFKRLE